MQGADIILQSHGLISFRVHKSTLAISSPFFADLFSLPQPPNDTVVDGLPIVQVSEEAELLHSLLTIFYPIPSVIPDSYEKTLALLAALYKYNIDIAPPGSALHGLVHFRKRCRDSLLSFFEGFVSGNDGLSKHWYGCRKTKRPHSSLQSDQGTLAGWLHTLILWYIKNLQAAYTCSLPNQLSLRQELVAALRARISETHCSSCSVSYGAGGETLREQFLHKTLWARDKGPFRLDPYASNNPSGDLVGGRFEDVGSTNS
ncbi:hypothetical protein EDB87DRAFT_1578178 [Lactarius vividus]|nr:hypothetical protein EDB87DRAFT_1578178 [Lactarius vividus]